MSWLIKTQESNRKIQPHSNITWYINRMKKYLLNTFAFFSKFLRNTPLKNIRWISKTHMRIFGLLENSRQYKLSNFILETDPRDRTIAKKISLYGDYEEYVRQILLSYAKPNTTIVDIGANIGLHTIPLSKKIGPQGKILSFEPDPDNYRILKKNIELNGLQNVTTYNIGLSDKPGKANLFQSDENRGGLSICEKNVSQLEGEPRAVHIELSTGDIELANCTPEISLIKIDVEGAEPLVIQGMSEVLNQNKKAVIVFEFSPKYIINMGLDPNNFLSSFINKDYRLLIIDEKNRTTTESSVSEIVKLGDKSDNALNLIAELKVK